MHDTGVLRDAFERIRDAVHPAANGLTVEELAFRPDPESNSIAWLVWHLTRIQDDHVADLRGVPQVWLARGLGRAASHCPSTCRTPDTGTTLMQWPRWSPMPPRSSATSRTSTRPPPAYLGTITDRDLDRVVDRRWDPPVTVGVRLVSVIADDLQHVGQASYVRGIVAAPLTGTEPAVTAITSPWPDRDSSSPRPSRRHDTTPGVHGRTTMRGRCLKRRAATSLTNWGRAPDGTLGRPVALI